MNTMCFQESTHQVGFTLRFRSVVWAGLAMSALVLAAAIPFYAQSEQESKSFEAASVKRLLKDRDSNSTGGGPGSSDPGRWHSSNTTLASVFVLAFHVQGHAMVGPDWMRSTRYDIEAKVPAGANRDDLPLMLQRLIIERFGLKFHREQKEMTAYALVTGKSAPKLTPSTASPTPIPHRDGYPELPEGVAPGVTKVDSVGYLRRFVAGAMSMPEFADYLAGQADLPVVDLTGLRGKYDILLYYLKPAISASLSATGDDNPFDLLSALREQLGLELQTRKTRVDLLVIDHIEQTPSAN
jgi:uncharacterized protein (TIGR03435 family)